MKAGVRAKRSSEDASGGAPEPTGAADYVAGPMQVSLTLGQAAGHEPPAENMSPLARQTGRYTQIGPITPARHTEAALNRRAVTKALMVNQVEVAAQAMEKVVDDAGQEGVCMLGIGTRLASARALATDSPGRPATRPGTGGGSMALLSTND